MSQAFSIGDTVKIKRSGLEVEVTAVADLPSIRGTMGLCAWINEPDEYMEVWFNANDLEFVRAKDQPAETVIEKPLARHRKRKAVESE